MKLPVFAQAACATDLTIAEAEERLVGLLHQQIRPKEVAGELMSSPVITRRPRPMWNGSRPWSAPYVVCAAN